MSTRLLAGRYELQDKIGDGGMAVVYKAKDRILFRHVAIKILKPEFAQNAKFIENFRRESQAAASMSHPNIVNIYDVGREGNIHYIVMELIEGAILSDLIEREGALEWRKAVEIAKQISSALAFAHKNHIIHRDVKPHNILLTGDGIAKITDFGIASALDSAKEGDNTAAMALSAARNDGTTIMGSVHYFSPEQARGGYVDEKSDIYSLGIVLFEMLTGKVPFDAETPVDVALKHINEEMPRPSDFKDGIPPKIEEVVMKATSKLQINRYSSADEMYDALSNAEFATMMQPGAGAPRKAAVAAESPVILTPSGFEYGNYEEPAEPEIPEESFEDEEDAAVGKKEKKKGKKVKRKIDKLKVGAIVLAFIIAIPISILLSSLFGGGGNKEIEAPDFRGMTFEAATSVAEEYKLELKEGNSVYSSDYESGMICSQTPDVGAAIKEGKTITVTISKGAKEGTVPNLVGKSRKDAEYALKKYGYRVGTVTEEANNLPEGIVISQSPAAGEEIKPGSYVSFAVSLGKGENEAIVPLLYSKTKAEAEKLLADAGLTLGTVTYEKSTTIAEGSVLWQSVEANATVENGSAINIKVSSGENGTSGGSEGGSSSVPTIYVDYSQAANDVFWLTVTVSDESGTHNQVTRAQRIKADGGERITLEGTGKGSVTVIFDNNVVAQYSVDFNAGTVQ